MKITKIQALSVCVLVLCLLFCSCQKTSYGNTPTSPTYGDSSDTQDTDAVTQTPHIPVKIAAETVYDKNGITVSISEIDNDSFWGPEIKLDIKNSSDKNIELECTDSSVNGIMQTLLFYAKADAGATVSDSITIYRDDLTLSKSYGIKEIEFKLVVKNKDDGTLLDTSDIIRLTPTGAEDFVQDIDTSGAVMLDVDGVRVIAKKARNQNSISGSKLYLFIENNSAQSMEIRCTELKINGTVLDAHFECKVLSGKVAISEVSVLESDLKKQGISDIKKIDVSLTFIDTETKEELFTLPMSAQTLTFVG